jgi:hypothetical protein
LRSLYVIGERKEIKNNVKRRREMKSEINEKRENE